jgi:hypothetical protein
MTTTKYQISFFRGGLWRPQMEGTLFDLTKTVEALGGASEEVRIERTKTLSLTSDAAEVLTAFPKKFN